MANNGNYWGFLGNFCTDFVEPVPVIEARNKDCLERWLSVFGLPFFLKVQIQSNGSAALSRSHVAVSPTGAGDGFGIPSFAVFAPLFFGSFPDRW